MSINLHGLRTVVYMTTELNKAKEWYAKVFGITPYFDEPFYVGFNVGGYELGLHPADTATAPTGNGGGIAYWGVDNVPAAYAAMLAAGATQLEEPTEVGGDIVTAAVIDPWGNQVGLIYNPHFKL